MYRIATSTEYVFDNKCLTYDEAVEVKNNLEKENPTCKLFIYKEQFIVYCNEAMCDKILLYNDEIEECNELYHFDGKKMAEHFFTDSEENNCVQTIPEPIICRVGRSSQKSRGCVPS